MEVEKLMSRDVQTVRGDDTLYRASQIMWECDCGSVPVVDESDRVIAMITDRDIAMAAYLRGERLADIAVGSAMSRDLVTVRARESVESTLRLMQERQVRRVPVIDDDGRLAGVLSMNDIARAAGSNGKGVSHEDVARTLAAISEPHKPTEATGGPGQTS